MDTNELGRGEEVDRERVRIVDLRQYCDLLVSRRKLERDRKNPRSLRDRESDELFVLQPTSDERLA